MTAFAEIPNAASADPGAAPVTGPPGSALLALKQRVDQVVGWTLATGMGLAVLAVWWQVMSRYGLGSPSTWTDEFVRYLLVWIGLLGAAYGVGQKSHLAIDLLAVRWSSRSRHALGLFIQVAIASFALAVMVGGGILLVQLSFFLGQTSAALDLPLGYVYLGLPIAGLLILFYCAVLAAEHWVGWHPPAPRPARVGWHPLAEEPTPRPGGPT